MPKKISSSNALHKDIKHLYEAFSKAGDTGRKDHMKKATNQARVFDNKYSTDFVGQLSDHIGCGPSCVRKNGQFTKSNGLKETAQLAFLIVADNVNAIDVNAILRSAEPYEQCHQPEESQGSLGL